ncbi:hypothetical protein Tco_1221762, partial [Tanacetum coccineum]
RNDQPQRQGIQPQGEDSDVEDEFEDGWNRGRRFGHKGTREFDYRQRAKDVPTFHGNRSVEVYTSEFHRLSSRNDLSKTESQQVTRYINGLSPQIHDKISLVPVYTLDDAYNLVIRAENQLARSSMLIKSVLNVDPSLQHTTKISYIDTGKQICHRSNDCRANDGKVNLTLRDDEFSNGGETNNSHEDVDAEICHPKGGDYASTEHSAHSFANSCYRQENLQVYVSNNQQGFAAALVVLNIGASQSRQQDMSESEVPFFTTEISQVTYRRACLMLALEGFPSSL